MKRSEVFQTVYLGWFQNYTYINTIWIPE